MAQWPAGYTVRKERTWKAATPHTVRRDRYLFGSGGYRYWSAREFTPHAAYLVAHATDTSARCTCGHCPDSVPASDPRKAAAKPGPVVTGGPAGQAPAAYNAAQAHIHWKEEVVEAKGSYGVVLR
ncbi:hypothetical protein JCM3774_006779 [Rhodotorula dairenensis]